MLKANRSIRSSVLRVVTCIAFFAVPSTFICAQDKKPTNYEQNVKPILQKRCLNCHNADDQEADLDLSSFNSIMKGGSSGKVVKAGSPANSILFQSINHEDGVEPMPPESPKIADSEIETIDQWIRDGLLAGADSKPKMNGISVVKPARNVTSPLPNLEEYPGFVLSKVLRAPIPQAVASSPGAPLIAVSGHKQVLLYGKRNRSEKSKFEFLSGLAFPEGTVHSIKFSRDGSLLVVAGGVGAQSGKVVIFDIKTGKRIAEFGDEVDSVLAADLSADFRWLVLGNSKKMVKIFDTTTGKMVHRIKKHTDWITSVSFCNGSDMVATGDRAGGVYIWEAAKGAIVLNLQEHKVRINDLAWRFDDQVIASGAEDGTLVVWSLKDGFPVLNVRAHFQKKQTSRYSRNTGILSVNFLKDGKLLTSGRDQFVKVWNAKGQQETAIQTRTIPVQVRPINELFAMGLFSGEVKIVDKKNTLATFDGKQK